MKKLSQGVANAVAGSDKVREAIKAINAEGYEVRVGLQTDIDFMPIDPIISLPAPNQLLNSITDLDFNPDQTNLPPPE